MRYALLLLFWCCCLGSSYAKMDPQALYWVSLKDKANSPFSMLCPQQYLSPRAIDRRQMQGIAIDEKDLPVNPQYRESIQKCGAQIRYQSKWFNALVVLTDSTGLMKIKALDFVEEVEYVGKYFIPKNSKTSSRVSRNRTKSYQPLNLEYGYADHQIGMMQGQALHQLGFRGKDILVAILDGGFIEADQSPFFDSLRVNGRLNAGWDFVDIDQEVYESSTHGMMVLSTMAANLPGLLIGSAPDATYTCIKTEDTRGEYRIEECNWIAGAEYADSLGANIINSSLGYTTFSDTTMDYTYLDMNGQASRASLAGDIAFSKGMVVVNSIGNSGSDPWKYMGVPADGFYTLAIGATDFQGQRASFSSFGPTADGRIKPNISAMGENLAVASINGYDVISGNGTSFSAPLVAGMIASLWSALPNYSQKEIFDLVQVVGNNYPKPDVELGYGIPDFLRAFLQETVADHLIYLDGNDALVVLPPGEKVLRLILVPDSQRAFEVVIRDVLGHPIWSQKWEATQQSAFIIHAIAESAKWPAGLYSVELSKKTGRQHLLFRLD